MRQVLLYADDVMQSVAEDEERRRIRRERNKLAAARCRQRRVDLTNQLLAVRPLYVMSCNVFVQIG